ncbi:MAG: hypothetical protein P8Y23_01570 [Candidatus Lokiarchaeota archaeon]|jgi:ABC-type dipeptide/oligopeptide/nickel transport system permease component
MTQKASLVILTGEETEELQKKLLFDDFILYNKNQIYIDEYKLLDYKLDPLKESNVHQSSQNGSFNTLKVIGITILISSLIQTILYIFVIPNYLNWSDKLLDSVIIFGWSILFNFIFFAPEILKKLAKYMNKAFTAYEYL